MTTPPYSQAKAKRFKRELAQRIQKNRKRVWEWHLEHARRNPPPFYCSVDLRDSGYKIVPVDSNLYPAGFNNICPADLGAAPSVMRAQLEAAASRRGLPAPKRVLILPESHTSNQHYFENLYYLRQILLDAGFEAAIGWYGPIPAVPNASDDGVKMVSTTGKEMLARPIRVADDGQLSAGDFTPDLVLLNNDFSSGYPEPLDAVKQPILPSHELGWHSRKKSRHFTHYNRLATEFASILEIDPWSITIDTEEVNEVNFNEDIGIDRAADAVGRVLARTKEAYERHGIQHEPFAFVKNNAGTYGMGITVVHSADELRAMNRRTKNKMSVGKNRQAIESVAVQEGIPTATLVDRLAAEPVIYVLGCDLIGGFLRTNTERGIEENLNSAGMVFKKLCMSDLRKPTLDPGKLEDIAEDDADKDEPVLELVYGSIARISALATGMELAEG